MRKAYKKARWKRMAERVKKRGGMTIFGFKIIHHVKAPDFPFTYEGVLQCIDYLEHKDEQGGDS